MSPKCDMINSLKEKGSLNTDRHISRISHDFRDKDWMAEETTQATPRPVINHQAGQGQEEPAPPVFTKKMALPVSWVQTSPVHDAPSVFSGF